jgi:hypothetical protein
MVAGALGGAEYPCDQQRWSVLLVEGDLAAFVLPVVFTSAARDDLDVGTIYHVGVIPGQRYKGLGALPWQAEPMHC